MSEKTIKYTHLTALFNEKLGIQQWQIIHQSKAYKVEKRNTHDSDPFFETVEIEGKERDG